MGVPYTDLRNEWGLTPDSAGAAAANTAIFADRIANGDRALLVPPGLYYVNPITVSTARKIFGVSAGACELRLNSTGTLFSCPAAWTIIEQLKLSVAGGVTGVTGISGTGDRLCLSELHLDGFDVDGVRFASAKLASWMGVLAENCGDGFDLGGGSPDSESNYVACSAKGCTVGWRFRTGCPGTWGHADAENCATSHQVDSDGIGELVLAARGTGNGPTITGSTGYLLIQSGKAVNRTGGAKYVQP